MPFGKASSFRIAGLLAAPRASRAPHWNFCTCDVNCLAHSPSVSSAICEVSDTASDVSSHQSLSPPILSVAAPASGTGKTTLIEKLIPLLARRGVRTAVIKSDSHGFNLDTEGKDTARFMTAGAEAVAVSSPDGYFIQQRANCRKDFQNLITQMDSDSLDLYITESRSRGVLPTLMLYRGMGELESDERVVALFAKNRTDDGILCADLDDMDTAVRLALFLIGRPLYGADGEIFLTL